MRHSIVSPLYDKNGWPQGLETRSQITNKAHFPALDSHVGINEAIISAIRLIVWGEYIC